MTSLSANVYKTLETDELRLKGRERQIEVNLPSVIYSQPRLASIKLSYELPGLRMIAVA